MAGKLQGPRYPAAASAWKGGVMLTLVVQNQLPRPESSGELDHHLSYQFTSLGKNLEYKFIPHCVGKIPNCEVLYYNAYNKTFERSEFAISPDKLDLFVDNAERFVSIAGMYYTFTVNEWQVKASQFAYTGNGGTLLESWGGAITDPGWVLQMLSPLAARGLPTKPTASPPKPPSPIKKAPPPPAPKGGGGGLREGKSHFPRGKGIEKGTNLSSAPNAAGAAAGESAGAAPAAVKPPPPPPKAAGGASPPHALKAMRSMDTLSGQQMREFLRGNLRDSPCLQRLCHARKLTGAAKHAELMQALDDLTAHTGIPVEKVPKGTVQKVRGQGDTASFRSKKGAFQIEEQVFDDTAALEDALSHDISAYYGNNVEPKVWRSPRLARGGPMNVNAGDLLEWTVKNGGAFPNVVEAMLGQ